jgi:ATP-dependent exoDNAse (exonuclease V) beta subunit
MDKRVIFAVAGAGKTTYIVKQLNLTKRSLIVTYTTSNYKNLQIKIVEKFGGEWPKNITLMTYFTFLYYFCYRPFLADKIKARGIYYERNPNKYLSKEERSFYLTNDMRFYSNRLAFFLERANTIKDIQKRIERYFDEFIIDEIQDVSGRDFNFILHLAETNIRMLFVGDFFQHTFDTSRDGNVNANLYKNYDKYKTRFLAKGFNVDESTLDKSWRCHPEICSFVRDNLKIEIYSHHQNHHNTYSVCYLEQRNEIDGILGDDSIVKLHYQKSSEYGKNHRNWGETKGEDHYHDVCIVLNKTTQEHFFNNTLDNLAPSTKNRLYVALTRARGNVYLVSESSLIEIAATDDSSS